MNVSTRDLQSKNSCPEALVIGAVMIVAAVYKLYGFLSYEYYQFMFQNISEFGIKLRYCLSIGLRLAILVIGCGIIRRQEFYRKVAIGVSSVNILLMYWKHPFEVFYYVAVLAEANFPKEYPVITGTEILAFPYFPWISMMVNVMIDVGFSALVIYFLTRINIKKKFI